MTIGEKPQKDCMPSARRYDGGMITKSFLPLVAGLLTGLLTSLVAALPVEAFEGAPSPVKANAQSGKGATIGLVLLLLIVGAALMSPRRNTSQD